MGWRVHPRSGSAAVLFTRKTHLDLSSSSVYYRGSSNCAEGNDNGRPEGLHLLRSLAVLQAKSAPRIRLAMMQVCKKTLQKVETSKQVELM